MTTATATRTRKARKPLTAAKQAKRAEARKLVKAQLDEAAALVESGDYGDDDLTADEVFAAFVSLTGHYSEGNALLILAQAALSGQTVRTLNDVGGFNAFAERGRKPRAGEQRSIFVWARITRPADEDADDVKVEQDEKGAKVFYRPVGIYHVSQTEKI